MNQMPFLFNVYKDVDLKEYDYTIVKIAFFSMVHIRGPRWEDKELPEGKTLVPDINIEIESYKFDSEQIALTFIQKWWKMQ